MTAFEYALDLAPASLGDGYHNASQQAWGGSILKADDGGYHIWSAAFVGGCNLAGWTQNSQVWCHSARL